MSLRSVSLRNERAARPAGGQGCDVPGSQRLPPAVVTELHTIACLPPLSIPAEPMVKPAHILTCRCWLLFCTWKPASNPKELLSSLLLLDPSRASRSPKKRQPLKPQPATVGAPFLGQASWPTTAYSRIVGAQRGVPYDPELRLPHWPLPTHSKGSVRWTPDSRPYLHRWFGGHCLLKPMKCMRWQVKSEDWQSWEARLGRFFS